jgi:small multidrug resistance pump
MNCLSITRVIIVAESIKIDGHAKVGRAEVVRTGNVMHYLYLAAAIVAEVVATSSLKACAQFTKPIPSVVVIVGYGIAFYLMTVVLKFIPVGVTYALWSGLGIVLVTITGAIVYKEVPDIPAVIGMGLIVAGAVILNIGSNTVSH